MEYVIFDLEATCEDKEINPDFTGEIIEIGAVKLNSKGEIVDTFSKFARPSEGVILTEFCKKLTTITQEDVNGADNLDDVLVDFYEWSYDCELVSWGGYDMRQIIRDVTKHNISSEVDTYDMKSRHFNFKEWYAKHHDIKPCGMFYALRREHLKLEGTHHRGIDDAKNISKIFVNYIHEI